MSEQTRLISAVTLLVAVVLASIALFILDDRNLARILFALVIAAGYGYLFVRWRRRR